MNEMEMRDQILQELMTAMDDMGAKKPGVQEEIKVAVGEPEASPSPGMMEDVKKTMDTMKKKATGDINQQPYADPKRNDAMKEVELQSKADGDDDDLPASFHAFLKAKKRG